MIQHLLTSILKRTLHRRRAHAHLRRFRGNRSTPTLRSRWIPKLSYAQRMTTLIVILLSGSFAHSLHATGYSEVHVVDLQWFDIKMLLQTQIKALAEEKETAIQAARIAQSTKSMELLQNAQAQIAFQMKTQIPALQQHGQILRKSPNGESKFVSADTLQFNPQTGQVEGGNFGFTDHLLSQRGVPISMDKIAPTWIVPVPEGEVDLLLKKSKAFIEASAKPLLHATTNSILGNNPNLSTLKSVINQGGGQVISGLLKEGLFIRPYEPGKDDAYAYYQNASPEEKMAYFSSPLYRDQSTIFNPVLGSISEQAGAAIPSTVDLSNTFSQGAKNAIETYLQTHLQTSSTVPTTGTFHSPSENPYSDFAAALYDQVIQSIHSGAIKPGDPILITPEMVQNAQQINNSTAVPQSTKSFPPLFNSSPKLSLKIILFPFLAAIGSPSPGTSITPYPKNSKKYILTVTGSPEEIQQLQSICVASDQQLGTIQKQIGYQTQMLDYTQQLITSLRAMRSEAQKVQQSISPKNAIPQVTQFLAAIDEAISARDREIANYQRTIQQLQGERFEELKSRAERVTRNHQEQQSTANHQLARAAK